MRDNLGNISKILTYTLIVSSVFMLFSGYKISALPDANLIVVDGDPDQSSTRRKNFIFDYADQAYQVEPLYDYEISGMIVSHNNITSITDAYHTSKSVDIKDLCIIWGDNFKDNIHKKLKFWSEAWTCNVQYDDYEIGSKFRGDQLSNNHLLSEHPSVREKIKKAKKGDQVKFSGMLVNYCPTLYPDMKRKSSTIRTDTGNGACEVVFVEDFEIVKEWQPTWSRIYRFSKNILIISAILKVLSFLVFPYLEYRAMK